MTIDWKDVDPVPQEDGSYVIRSWAAGKIRVGLYCPPIGLDMDFDVDLPAEKAVLTDLGVITVQDGYVDSTMFEFPDGKVRIRGVPAGPHIVIIGAKGHVGEVRRIVMARGEVRTLSVNLPAR